MHEYELTRGEGAEFWLDRLRAPGGGPLLRPPEPSDTGWWLRCEFELEPVAKRMRWQRAQSAEADFWRGWRRNQLYRDVDPADFWADFLQKTGGPLPSGTLLDVGCGPVSLLNYHRSAGMYPIGIDPLAEFYLRENIAECRSGWQPIPMVSLPAEHLPFESASIDHALCCNVLDHVSDASAVLLEMRRVIKPGGTLRVYVHSFESWIKRLLFFDRPHVYHWDHVEFQNLLEAHGFEVVLEFREPKTFNLPLGLWGKLRFFPYWVASKVCYTSYFQLKRPK